MECHIYHLDKRQKNIYLSFCKIGNYYHYKLYEFYPYQYEISSFLRSGFLTIDEGLKMLQEVELDENNKKT